MGLADDEVASWEAVALATARPHGPPRAPAPPGPDALLRLSRVALLRREGAELLLESPIASARVVLHDRRLLPLLHDLVEPATLAELRRRSPDLPAPALDAVLALLHRHGLVVDAAEEDAPTWAFHDLLFHGRTRHGYGAGTLGKTYPFRGRFEPPPAVEPFSGDARIALPRPDLDEILRHDPPFAAVVEARRSIRAFGAEPLAMEALSELLSRTLRVRRYIPATPDKPYDTTDRPCPSAGTCHPLEAYLAVDRCNGILPGFYHYDPSGHALERVRGPDEKVSRLLQNAAHAAGVKEPPPVLLILAARFARVAWAYGGLSYSLILKDVGVVFQSVYLAATAMGLGACALGVGDARLFAEVAGTDDLDEASVGEIMIGRPARGPSAAGS